MVAKARVCQVPQQTLCDSQSMQWGNSLTQSLSLAVLRRGFYEEWSCTAAKNDRIASGLHHVNDGVIAHWTSPGQSELRSLFRHL